MRAYELAIQNFSIAEHLLQLFDLFRELKEEAASEPLRLAVCRAFAVGEQTVLRHAKNEQIVLIAKATAPVPPSLLLPDGINFLLRQAVVVACTALESFYWDALRESVLTIVRTRRRKADDSLRSITLTLDDYLSIEGYEDAELRLRQIILKNFARGTLYDISSIERIVTVLTVKGYWAKVAEKCGLNEADIKRQLGDLITRRNQIAHRADRPEDDVEPPEECDGHGLRAITHAWANARVATARNVVSASADIFKSTIEQLEAQLHQEEEQKLAQRTLRVAAVLEPVKLESQGTVE